MNTPTNSEALPLTNCSASSDSEKYAEPHGSKERVEEQLRIALDGWAESELWGENGLIAATMRAARVASKLEDVIQKFRDEEDCLLLDKSSRALGGAIAYGAMADELSKLISLPNARDLAPPQAVEDDADEEESCKYCGNGITELVVKWRDMPSEEMRLRAGDMTAQEIRSVKAVLNAILPNVKVHTPLPESASDETEVKP